MSIYTPEQVADLQHFMDNSTMALNFLRQWMPKGAEANIVLCIPGDVASTLLAGESSEVDLIAGLSHLRDNGTDLEKAISGGDVA